MEISLTGVADNLFNVNSGSFPSMLTGTETPYRGPMKGTIPGDGLHELMPTNGTPLEGRIRGAVQAEYCHLQPQESWRCVRQTDPGAISLQFQFGVEQGPVPQIKIKKVL